MLAVMLGHTGVECSKLKSACEKRYELLQKATAAAKEAAAAKLKNARAVEETPAEFSESSISHLFFLHEGHDRLGSVVWGNGAVNKGTLLSAVKM